MRCFPQPVQQNGVSRPAPREEGGRRRRVGPDGQLRERINQGNGCMCTQICFVLISRIYICIYIYIYFFYIYTHTFHMCTFLQVADMYKHEDTRSAAYMHGDTDPCVHVCVCVWFLSPLSPCVLNTTAQLARVQSAGPQKGSLKSKILLLAYNLCHATEHG